MGLLREIEYRIAISYNWWKRKRCNHENFADIEVYRDSGWIEQPTPFGPIETRRQIVKTKCIGCDMVVFSQKSEQRIKL